VGVGVSPLVGCHGIVEVLSSVSPFKKGWESLLQAIASELTECIN
jgi:hypothetical protein